MQITAATEAEAERIVAEVWLVLERTKLPSPKVTVRPQPPSLILDFQFAQNAHEECVGRALLPAGGDRRSSRQPEPLG